MKGQGEKISQIYMGKIKWVLQFGLSKDIRVNKPEDLIKMYTIIIRETIYFEIKD